MKTIPNLSFLVSVSLLAAGCHESKPADDAPSSALLKNRSGYSISIIHKPSCKELPDSLVLRSGEAYELSGKTVHPDGIPFFGRNGFTNRSIVYDGRWALPASSLPDGRNFLKHSSFTSEGPSASVFTFTKDDYAYAVRYGDDLTMEPGEPVYARNMLLNRSGHTVSIVHRPVCRDFPDSLVLRDGESHDFDGNANADFFYKDFKWQAVYYDGRYRMELKNLPSGYRFNCRNAYVFQSAAQTGTGFRAFVYTLTQKDYDYAVTHGADLGAGK